MQVCKSRLCILIALIFVQKGFCQSVSTPQMPQMPSMPSMPTVGGSFYTPSFPTGSVAPSQSSTSSTTKSSTSDIQSILTNSTNTDDIVTSLLTNSSILSASDITSLYDSGMFDSISSLNSTSSNLTTNLLLQQVLTSLNDLKTQQKNASPEEKQMLQNTQTDSQTFKKREPSILRFKVNGYDIMDSLTTVFFSEPEPDGTFLLTADRKYFTNQKPRTETFYVLFKAVKSNGSVTTFDVQPSISQDSLNENSYVYKFSKGKKYIAEKTGNLVVLHSSEDTLKVDLLLDIDKD